MASLLTLPREVRDKIYNHVLTIPIPICPPSLDLPFYTALFGFEKYPLPKLASESSAVLYRPLTSYSLLDDLRLVNRQLSAETFDSLKRWTKGRNVSYSLDILILDGEFPLVTWTSVPFLARHVDRLDVTLRISPANENMKHLYGGLGIIGPRPVNFESWLGERVGFNENVLSWPPPFWWQLWSILLRFFRVGPLGFRRLGNENFHFTARRIVIDVQGESPDPENFGFAIDEVMMDADTLANGIRSMFEKLLQMDDQGPERDCKRVLFEHVDEIHLSRKGGMFDVDVMKELERVESSERVLGMGLPLEAREELRRYKEKTWQVREERGLRVPE